MNQRISWEDRVKGAYASLRPSEQKVAEALLANRKTAAGLTIGELARLAGVSQPTVIRCVRALGFPDFRAFKAALTAGPAGRSFTPLEGFCLQPWERAEDLPLKALEVHRELLEQALKAVPPRDLEAAARALAGARLVDIYRVENSLTPANDLLTKLTYLGLPCRLNTDPYLQQIGAAHLTGADAAVAFSRSGRSADTERALRLARRAGAFTIGVCGEKDSPVARQADLCLWTGAVGGTIYGSAIFSRVADLAVVDLLYMEIILSDYRTFSRSLDKSGAVIAGREYKET